MGLKEIIKAEGLTSQETYPLLKDNPISKKQRLTELLVDWLMICLYLISLFLIIIVINYFVYGEVFPSQDEQYSQFIATFTTTIPITLAFAWLDYSIWKKLSRSLMP